VHIAQGSTRFVLIVGDVAIKFPKVFKPSHILKHIYKVLTKKENLKEKLDNYHTNFFLALLRYFISPILINWEEYKDYRRYSDLGFLAPTYFSLWGLVNIQMRGDPITEVNRKEWERRIIPLQKALLMPHYDSFQADNWCFINGKPHLIDYSNNFSKKILSQFALSGVALASN
jgi:hypothetical protein